MEFGEKLQELRKQKGITQEELAGELFVSRTAVSKWESGRGYPNIDSLKAIAVFFSVTVDELLSPNEIITIAVEDKNQTESRFRDLTIGLLDVCALLLVFLPFFAVRTADGAQEASLLTLVGVQPYLMVLYFAVVVAIALLGIATLCLQNVTHPVWSRIKTTLSIAFSLAAVLLFIVTLQPYASVFAFALLGVKVFLAIKR
jgi:transcriptional regulator with XRE-family HTH domain